MGGGEEEGGVVGRWHFGGFVVGWCLVVIEGIGSGRVKLKLMWEGFVI